MGCGSSTPSNTAEAVATPIAQPAKRHSAPEPRQKLQSVKAYGTASATDVLGPLSITRRAPLEDDVAFKVLFCGVCHSDLHSARNDWGTGTYPMVPGHEIVGVVTAVGSKVSNFKVGDKVGVGCLVDSCQSCKACAGGLEQYCNGMVLSYGSPDKHIPNQLTYGGYSESFVVREEFALRMPDNLDLAAAAPLLCAGITMWSPLAHWKVGKGTKVGIVGLGGLGHMGLKLAKALGAEVTLFSRSRGKEDEAKSMGADKIVISTDKDQMDAVANYFDVIIDTVPVEHDVGSYVNCVGLDGTVVIVGHVGPLAEKINTAPMIFKRKTVAGSLIGGIKETQEMLDFCGKHSIVSEIEKIAMQDINAAYTRMEKADVRYRFVIDISTL